MPILVPAGRSSKRKAQSRATADLDSGATRGCPRAPDRSGLPQSPWYFSLHAVSQSKYLLSVVSPLRSAQLAAFTHFASHSM